MPPLLHRVVLVLCTFAANANAADPITPPSTAPAKPATAPATRPAEVTTPPPREQFLVLALHVHILTAPGRDDIDCTLTDADIERIVGKANRVWAAAGICFRVESLSREAAVNIEAFDQKRKESAPQPPNLGIWRMLAPPATARQPGFHVYYTGALPPNGVYLGGNVSFVKQSASLRKVEGGIDEPLPRVTAHELGHALGLAHRQDRTNLMASGTTGTTLNTAEIARARGIAARSAGVMTPAQCEVAAREAKETDAARAVRLETALKALPDR